jgi:crossover junction endodeoxyribonuclease RuvC
MIVIGVDPGLGGAIAAVTQHRLLDVDDMPTEDMGGKATVKRRVSCSLLATLLRDYRARYGGEEWLVVMERVSAGSGQGVASAFSFGDSYGAVRGVVQTMRMRMELVTPSQWKQSLKVPKDKNVARTIASTRWPESAAHFARKKDDGRAEAALIAQYGLDVFA